MISVVGTCVSHVVEYVFAVQAESINPGRKEFKYLASECISVTNIDDTRPVFDTLILSCLA